jgi:hypothetical protein
VFTLLASVGEDLGNGWERADILESEMAEIAGVDDVDAIEWDTL